MFDKYYFTKQAEQFIIYEALSVDKGVEMSLYINEELIDTKSGLLGQFVLEGDDINLKIKNKALKSTHVLTYKGAEIELQKIKLKELRKQLTKENIYSKINPTLEQIEASRFKVKTLLIPVLLLLLGLVIQYFVKDMSRFYNLIAVIPEVIAGSMLYDIVAKSVPWFAHYRKGRLGFMVFAVVGMGLLGEFLFQFI